MEKSNKNRVCALRFKNIKKIVDRLECVFLQFPSHKGIQQPSAANYFVRGNARALCRWRSITKTQPEDEEHGIIIGAWKASAFWRQSPRCQKFDGICSLIPSLNVQLLCFHFFGGGMLFFFPTGSCGPCALVGNVGFTYLPPTSPPSFHRSITRPLSKPGFLTCVLGQAGSLVWHQGLSLPTFVCIYSHCSASFLSLAAKGPLPEFPLLLLFWSQAQQKPFQCEGSHYSLLRKQRAAERVNEKCGHQIPLTRNTRLPEWACHRHKAGIH